MHTPGVRPPDQRLASALFSMRFKTHRRPAPLAVAKACEGGWFKKRKVPIDRARLRPSCA